MVIAFEERAAGGAWKPAKLALIRLQRVRDAWKKHAAVTLRGADALELAGTLDTWRSELAAPGDADDD